MTKKEVGQLLVLAVSNYPHMQDKDLRTTARLWQEILSDMPFELAKNALLKVLVTAKYWPTVAEIREAALALQNPGMISPAEAWSQANAALDKYGYYRADEGMGSLPTEVQKTIRACGGWGAICTSENIDTVRAQFLRMFADFSQTEHDYKVLPASVKNFMENVQIKQITG
ncbi:MAG: hypothetical protein GX369_08360 [Euryarchaeota archaeon]|nr:hypothetical protein [Euryarchaeota archaeon]